MTLARASRPWRARERRAPFRRVATRVDVAAVREGGGTAVARLSRQVALSAPVWGGVYTLHPPTSSLSGVAWLWARRVETPPQQPHSLTAACASASCRVVACRVVLNKSSGMHA